MKPGRARARGQVLPLFAIMLGLALLPVVGLAVDGAMVLDAHARLAGSAQAVAEDGAAALDVSAFTTSGVFRLCTAPAGDGACANGVGSAPAIIDRGVAALGLPACRPFPGAPPGDVFLVDPADPAPASGPSGCAYAFVAGCAAGLGDQPGPGYAPRAPVEVRVVLWLPVPLRILGLLGWHQVEIRAQARALLTHGYRTPVGAVVSGGAAQGCG
ncbi:MAG TPA: hypothetical protein VMW49_04260 [Candidatus Dormibacteraeota bacterium]|nr:hypothetical protein [Candidatus Dormibacteraeota bacterium]